jgi:MYXO-CTERM domain-containing protein
MRLSRLLRFAPLALVAFWSPDALAGPCDAGAGCTGAEPVCDTNMNLCVACADDFGSGNALECPTPTSPACNLLAIDGGVIDGGTANPDGGLLGQCTECTPRNLSRCNASNEPACTPSGQCGCNTDTECPLGKICIASTPPAGRCEPGCKSNGPGQSRCPAGFECSVTDGGQGTCVLSDAGLLDGGDGGAGDGAADGGAGDGATDDGGVSDGASDGATDDGAGGDATGADGAADDGASGDATGADGAGSDGASGDATVGDGAGSDGASGDATLSDGSGITPGTDAGTGGTNNDGGGGGTNNASADGLIEGGGCSCTVRGTDGPASIAAGLGLLLGVTAFIRRRRS